MSKPAPQAPVAPDPVKTAEAQGQINQNTATTQQLLNMVDQVTPTGSLTYSQNGSTSYTGAQGATVTRVVADGPADKAGITTGSKLIKVGDTAITENTNVATVIRALEPGQQVVIEWVTRSNQTRSATVTLGSSPVN